MKKSIPLLVAAAAVALAGSMGATPAFAQAVFTGAGQGTSCDPQKTNTSGTYTKTSANAFGQVVCTSGSVTTTLTAWGYMNGTTVGSTTSGTGFVQGNLGDFNSAGIGAYTGTNEGSANQGEHAFDNIATSCGSPDANNYTGTTPTAGGGSKAVTASSLNGGCGGSIEAMLLSFNSKVSISQLKSGYQGTDADFSIYVWTGTGGPDLVNQTLTNNAATGLAGWTLVSSGDFGGSVSDGTGQNPFNIAQTTSSLYSSYFLVTTYFGATTTSLNYGNDQFKISGWTANACAGTLTGTGSAQTCSTTPPPPGVPEPGSLALVGAALLGITASRRRLFGRR